MKEKKMEDNKEEERGLDTVRWRIIELKIKGKMKELQDINSKKKNEVRNDGITSGPSVWRVTTVVCKWEVK